MLRTTLTATFLIGLFAYCLQAFAQSVVQLGPRPLYLMDQLPNGELKTRLLECRDGPFSATGFSIGHRGAPLQFPEHTAESYAAAARMGAGVLECDVTFTKDKELVCRHSQCDLHTTTNVLAIPELASRCSVPFAPADPATGTVALAKCCTSDFTLAELRRLKGKMDAADKTATSVEAYLGGTPDWRTDLYAASVGTLLTHAESVDLFKGFGAKMTPELKTPEVEMPFGSFTQHDYAQKLIDEYTAAGVDARDVFVQSFDLDDVLYWVEKEPAFGRQAVYLDGRYADDSFDHTDPSTWVPGMAELKTRGVNYIAPPLWMLLRLENGEIVPSVYAAEAKKAGLKLITWTLERSGPLGAGGGWYYQTVEEAIDDDGDMLRVLDVLARDVGIEAIFSDWPATVTFYANCLGL